MTVSDTTRGQRNLVRHDLLYYACISLYSIHFFLFQIYIKEYADMFYLDLRLQLTCFKGSRNYALKLVARSICHLCSVFNSSKR